MDSTDESGKEATSADRTREAEEGMASEVAASCAGKEDADVTSERESGTEDEAAGSAEEATNSSTTTRGVFGSVNSVAMALGSVGSRSGSMLTGWGISGVMSSQFAGSGGAPGIAISALAPSGGVDLRMAGADKRFLYLRGSPGSPLSSKTLRHEGQRK